MSDLMKPLIYAASEGPLSRTQAEQAFELLFNGDATLSQMGGLLMAMRARGESVAEYAAAAAVMRAKCIAVSVTARSNDIHCTFWCGHSDTFGSHYRRGSRIFALIVGLSLARRGR